MASNSPPWYTLTEQFVEAVSRLMIRAIGYKDNDLAALKPARS
jgi:hypothetical protein